MLAELKVGLGCLVRQARYVRLLGLPLKIRLKIYMRRMVTRWRLVTLLGGLDIDHLNMPGRSCVDGVTLRLHVAVVKELRRLAAQPWVQLVLRKGLLEVVGEVVIVLVSIQPVGRGIEVDVVALRVVIIAVQTAMV